MAQTRPNLPVATVKAVHERCHKRLSDLTLAPTGCWEPGGDWLNAAVVEYDRQVAESFKAAERRRGLPARDHQRRWEAGVVHGRNRTTLDDASRDLGIRGPRPQQSQRRPGTTEWSWWCNRCECYTPRITEEQLAARVLKALRSGQMTLVIGQ